MKDGSGDLSYLSHAGHKEPQLQEIISDDRRHLRAGADIGATSRGPACANFRPAGLTPLDTGHKDLLDKG